MSSNFIGFCSSCQVRPCFFSLDRLDNKNLSQCLCGHDTFCHAPEVLSNNNNNNDHNNRNPWANKNNNNNNNKSNKKNNNIQAEEDISASSESESDSDNHGSDGDRSSSREGSSDNEGELNSCKDGSVFSQPLHLSEGPQDKGDATDKSKGLESFNELWMKKKDQARSAHITRAKYERLAQACLAQNQEVLKKYALLLKKRNGGLVPKLYRAPYSVGRDEVEKSNNKKRKGLGRDRRRDYGQREVICAEDAYEFLYNEHHNEGSRNRHLSIKKAFDYYTTHYYGITKAMCQEIKNKCVLCAAAAAKSTGRKLKHVRSTKVDERWQMDLINMQSYSNVKLKKEIDEHTQRINEINAGIANGMCAMEQLNQLNYELLCHYRERDLKTQRYELEIQEGRYARAQYILTVKDHLSRYIWLFPLPDKNCSHVAKCLKDLFCHFRPRILQRDNGGELNGPEIQELERFYKIKCINGRPYHSQSQGSVENANNLVEVRLANLLPRDPHTGLPRFGFWEKYLDLAMIQLNERKSEVIGMKPYTARYGHEPVENIELSISDDWVDFDPNIINNNSNYNNNTVTMFNENNINDNNNNGSSINAVLREDVASRVAIGLETTNELVRRSDDAAAISQRRIDSRAATFTLGQVALLILPQHSKLAHKSVPCIISEVVSVELNRYNVIALINGEPAIITKAGYCNNEVLGIASMNCPVALDKHRQEVLSNIPLTCYKVIEYEKIGTFVDVQTVKCKCPRVAEGIIQCEMNCKCVKTGHVCGSACHDAKTCSNKKPKCKMCLQSQCSGQCVPIHNTRKHNTRMSTRMNA